MRSPVRQPKTGSVALPPPMKYEMNNSTDLPLLLAYKHRTTVLDLTPTKLENALELKLIALSESPIFS